MLTDILTSVDDGLVRLTSKVATTTLSGTTGNDILNSPGSVQALVAGFQGNDTITLNALTDEANGGLGDDQITIGTSGVANNTISAGAGSDTLVVTTGNTSLGGVVNLDGGNDFFSNTGAVQAVGLSLGGNQGSDTIGFGAGTLLNTTVGGGALGDSLTFSGTLTNSQVLGGGGADTLNLEGTAASTLTTIQASDGHDFINATATTGSTTLALLGGAGFDSIKLGAMVISSVVGGGGNDTIFNAADTGLGAGLIFGDGMGDTTGTASTLGGADVIGRTSMEFTAALSVYGAAGNDSIRFSTISAANLVIDGGNSADVIGNSAATFSAVATTATVAGGAGADTIILGQGSSASTSFLIDGGTGHDSIFFGPSTGATLTVFGGDGADTINFANAVTAAGAATSNLALATLNGGAGADHIILGSWTADPGAAANVGAGAALGSGGATALLTAVSAITGGIMNVVYSATNSVGDTIFFNTTANHTQSNITTTNQIFVASAGTSALATAADLLVANLTGAGSVFVAALGNDLLVGISSADSATPSSFVGFNLLGGAAALNTTVTGAAVANQATNFDFTVAMSNTGITFTITA